MATVWELSALYPHTSTALQPNNGTHAITHHRNRITTRRISDMQVERTWALSTGPHTSRPFREQHSNTAHALSSASTNSKVIPPDTPLTSFAVSSSEPHLIVAYAGSEKQAIVLDPRHEQPIARLDVGTEGASAVAWTPDGSALLAWSACQLRLSIFPLASPSPVLHISEPKCSHPAGISFSPAKSALMAVLERRSGKDHVGIYDCASWKQVRHFPLPTPATDSAGILWSPCGRYIAVWEAAVDYILHIFTPDGRLAKTFEPYASLARGCPPTETDLERARKERSTNAWVGLGIRTVTWQPTGEWLAIGGYDGKVRILSRSGWASVAELSCPTRLVSSTTVWKEPSEWAERTRGKGIIPFEPLALPHSLTFTRADPAKPNPRMGVSQLSWSPSGCWLACTNQSCPNVAWIFSMLSTKSHSFRPHLHTALVHNSPIRAFAWQPAGPAPTPQREPTAQDDEDDKQELLAIVTGERGFTIWREPNPDDEVETNGFAECVGVPSQAAFGPTQVQFNATGDALLLADKNMFAFAYPVPDA